MTCRHVIAALLLGTIGILPSYAQDSRVNSSSLSVALSTEDQELSRELFRLDAMISESKNPILAYNTAINQFDLRNYMLAEYFLNRAIELDPYFAEAFLFLARVKIRQQEFEDAQFYGQKAVEFNPELVPAHLDLFLVYSRLNKKSAAEMHLLTAAKLDPEMVSRTASRLITEQDDLYGALYFFEKIHTVAPTNILNSLNYAKALMIAKLYMKAEKVLEIAYQASDYNDEHFELLYSMYFAKLLQHEKFSFVLDLASEKVPNDYSSQYLYKALSNFKLGNDQEFEANAELYFSYNELQMPDSLMGWAESECQAIVGIRKDNQSRG